MSVVRTAAALVVAGLLAIVGWSFATHWAPSPKRYPLQGVDLDANPPAVEWGSVRAAGADFAYLVATVGADGRDPAFEANWDALPDAGLRRGAVHLYSLCQPAIDQANAFNTVVPRAEDAMPTAVDVSFRNDCTVRPDRAALIAGLRQFATLVETHTGKPVLLRLSRSVESSYALSSDIARPLWVMGNFLPPGYGTRRWRMWRASTFRQIEGVDGPVNWDVVAE